MPHLYRHTRSLLIEYVPKGEDPSYKEVMRSGPKNWVLYGQRGAERQTRMLKECAGEALVWHELLSDERISQITKMFPNVERIAISSIYDAFDSIWLEYSESFVGQTPPFLNSPPKPQQVAARFHNLLDAINPKYICIRNLAGLLVIPIIAYASDRPPTRYCLTAHFVDDERNLPVLLGKRMTLSSDVPANYRLEKLIENIGTGLNNTRSMRQARAKVGAKWRKASDTAQLRIFCSTPTTEVLEGNPWGIKVQKNLAAVGYTSKAQRMLVAEVGRSTQEMLREGSGLKDTVEWCPSCDTPICLACGSGPPSSEIPTSLITTPEF